MSVVTTLLIEYLAKPWLEVRKDRILATDRERRAALRGLRRASYIAGRLLALRDSQEIEPLRDRSVRLAAEAEPLVSAAVEELETRPALTADWTQSMAVVGGMMILVQAIVPSGQVWDDFDAASGRLDLYADLLATPRARWWRRRGLIRQIKASPALSGPVAGDAAASDAPA